MSSAAAAAAAGALVMMMIGQRTHQGSITSIPSKATIGQLNRAAGSQSLEKLKAVIATGWTREDIDSMAPSTDEDPRTTAINRPRNIDDGDGHAGKTALHLAAWQGSLPNLQYLVDDLGCNVNVIATGRYCYGKTPIFFACTRSRSAHVHFLLDRGARVTIVNNKGQSVRSVAYSHFSPGNRCNGMDGDRINNDNTTSASDNGINCSTSSNILERISQLEQEQQMNIGWINYRATHSDGLEYGDLDPRFLDRPIRPDQDVLVLPWSVNPTTKQSRRGNFARRNPHAIACTSAVAMKATGCDQATSEKEDTKIANERRRTLSAEEQDELTQLWQRLGRALGSGNLAIPNTSTTTEKMTEKRHNFSHSTNIHSNNHGRNHNDETEEAKQLFLQILTLSDKQRKRWLEDTAYQLKTIWINNNCYTNNQNETIVSPISAAASARPEDKDGNSKNNPDSVVVVEEELINWLKTIPPKVIRQRILLIKLALLLGRDSNHSISCDSLSVDRNEFLQPLAVAMQEEGEDEVGQLSSSRENKTKGVKVSQAMQSLNAGLWPMACRAVHCLSFAKSLTDKPMPTNIETPWYVNKKMQQKEERQTPWPHGITRSTATTTTMEFQSHQSYTTATTTSPIIADDGVTAERPIHMNSATEDGQQENNEKYPENGDNDVKDDREIVSAPSSSSTTMHSAERIVGLKAPPIWIDSVEGLKQLWQTLKLPGHPDDSLHQMGGSNGCDPDNCSHGQDMDVVGIDSEWTDDPNCPGRNMVSTFQLAIRKRQKAMTTAEQGGQEHRKEKKGQEIVDEATWQNHGHEEQLPKPPDHELETYVVDVLLVPKDEEYSRICRDLLKVLFETKIVLGFAVGNDLSKLEDKFAQMKGDGGGDKIESLSLFRGNVLDLQRLWPKKQQPGLATCASFYCANHGGDQNMRTRESKQEEENGIQEEEDDNSRYNNNDTTANVNGKAVSRVRLSKAYQCSNWRRRPLRHDQLEYAALDAAVLLVILAEKARADGVLS